MDKIEEIVEDGDKIICNQCGKSHELVQGKLNGIRIGDGILFYICKGESYVGAINKRLVFGVKIWWNVKVTGYRRIKD